MRLYRIRVDHKSNDRFPYKEKRIWRHRDTQREDRQVKVEDWSYAATGKKHLESPEAGRRKEGF